MALITIVLADDHEVVRQGLRALLEREPGFSLVGETGDGLEAVRLVELLNPKVLVIDLMMPGLGGLEVTRRVVTKNSHTRVIVLSMYSNEAYVAEALKNGASGYVLKCSPAATLVRAIKEVASGRRYFGPPLSEEDIEAYMRRSSAAPLDLYETLTNREREVLQLTAEGHTSTEIATRLSISPRTVETHRANLMGKLGLDNQSDLVRYALRRGLLQLGE